MKALAGDLGVTTMALYRHVGDKETLVALALDAIADPFATIMYPDEPHACIRLAMTTLYTTLTAHPWVPEALIRPQRIGRGALLLADAVIGAAFDITGDRAAALAAYRALWSLTLGSVLSHLRQRAEGTPLSHDRLDELMGSVSDDSLPNLRASVLLDLQPSTGEDFEESLDALMTGLFASFGD